MQVEQGAAARAQVEPRIELNQRAEMVYRLVLPAFRIAGVPFCHGLSGNIADDAPGRRGRSVTCDGIGVSQGDNELSFAYGKSLILELECRKIADGNFEDGQVAAGIGRNNTRLEPAAVG